MRGGKNSIFRRGGVNIVFRPKYRPVASLKKVFIIFAFKGTVSPDIRLYFRVWKIKSVLYIGPLMIFTYFFCMKTLFYF
jgi:hypothetical protein